MSESFLNNAQLTGLSADARRTEILRAKGTAALDTRVETTETQLAELPQAIQSGRIVVATNGSGVASVIFPQEFAALPVMTNPTVNGTSVYHGTISALSTTGFSTTVRSIADGALYTIGIVTISWVAIGALA